MKHEFKFQFYTTEELSDKSRSKKLFGFLANSIAEPITYDSVEKSKIEFEKDSFQRASQIYSDEGALFIKGKADGFLAYLSRDLRGLSVWTTFLNSTAFKESKIDKWLDFFHGLIEQFNIIYGYGVQVEEYDAKHLELTNLPGGGRIRKNIGVSTLDFFKYLPGIYWFTVFGKELTNFFKSKFDLIDPEIAKITEFKSGETSLRLCLPPDASHLDLRVKQEREIVEILGEEYFFDREKIDKVRFKQVPKLTERFESETKT